MKKFNAIIVVKLKTENGVAVMMAERALNVQEQALLRRDRSFRTEVRIQPEAALMMVYYDWQAVFLISIIWPTFSPNARSVLWRMRILFYTINFYSIAV
jgi:hypothetical protein